MSNKFEITGRLVRDIEPKTYRTGEIMRTKKDGIPIMRGTVACNHSKRKGDVSYFTFVMFGKEGEEAQVQFGKGDLVFISGYLKQSRWHDGKTQRSNYEVKVNEIHPILPKGRDDSVSEEDVPCWIDDNQLPFGGGEEESA